MSVSFYQQWLGGRTGKELMPVGTSSLYYTIIDGELPNNGRYTGPGSYELEYIPREGSTHAYVNGVEVESDEIHDEYINISTPGTGSLSVSYSPNSELIYFGKNDEIIKYGASIRCPLVNLHITNIMYKMSQIEYAVGMPITIWGGTEVTTRDYDDTNFVRDATIIYSIKKRINIDVGVINNLYSLDIYTLDISSQVNPRKITIEDVEEIRTLIDAMQSKVSEAI